MDGEGIIVTRLCATMSIKSDSLAKVISKEISCPSCVRLYFVFLLDVPVEWAVVTGSLSWIGLELVTSCLGLNMAIIAKWLVREIRTSNIGLLTW
jgi:hypothetical protein